MYISTGKTKTIRAHFATRFTTPNRRVNAFFLHTPFWSHLSTRAKLTSTTNHSTPEHLQLSCLPIKTIPQFPKFRNNNQKTKQNVYCVQINGCAATTRLMSISSSLPLRTTNKPKQNNHVVVVVVVDRLKGPTFRAAMIRNSASWSLIVQSTCSDRYIRCI